MRKLNSKGFSGIETLLILIILGLVGSVGYYVFQAKDRTGKTASSARTDDAYTESAEFRSAVEQDIESIVVNRDPEVPKIETARPVCENQRNRPGIIIVNEACDYEIEALGNINLAIVSVYEDNNSMHDVISYPKEIKKYADFKAYIEKEAKKYNSELDLNIDVLGPFKISKSVRSLNYQRDVEELLKTFEAAAKENRQDLASYDMVHYIDTDYGYGGYWGSTSQHRSFALSTESIFNLRGILIQFGATLKYGQPYCKNASKDEIFGRRMPDNSLVDVMCGYSEILKIGADTAKEVGWTGSEED